MSQKNLLKIVIILLLSFLVVGCSLLPKPSQNKVQKNSEIVSIMGNPNQPNNLPKSPSIEKREGDSLYQLYYGTNRKPNDLNDYSKGYSSERGRKLYTGNCKILIPASHKIGKVDGSLWEKIIHLDTSYGKIKVSKIYGYKNSNELWSELRDKFKNLKNREALIFIHGYNNTFESSAIRAGQIGYDLKFKGIMAFYSWPSVGKTVGYTSDEATIQASEKYIKEFLVDFAQKSGASKVNIIAHSMGNRGLLRVINDISKENLSIKFGQIILAAPDVDADLFKNISQAYTKLSDRTTLYVSSKDKAVKLSKTLHNNPRAGLVKPVTVIDNIDTVNVNIDFNSLFSKFMNLNHTYFAKDKEILKDIRNLLNKEDSIDIKRKMNKNENSQSYWSLGIE